MLVKPSHACARSLVDVLQPFPGMAHLDVAGGTGDVAFRVLRAIRAAERARPAAPPPSAPAAGAAPAASGAPSGSVERGRVVVCDINPQMLEEGKKKAAAAPDLAGGARRGGACRGWSGVRAWDTACPPGTVYLTAMQWVG